MLKIAELIRDTACNLWGVTHEELANTAARKGPAAEARVAIVYVLRFHTGMSMAEVIEATGRPVAHSSMYTYCDTARKRCQHDPVFAQKYNTLLATAEHYGASSPGAFRRSPYDVLRKNVVDLIDNAHVISITGGATMVTIDAAHWQKFLAAWEECK